VAGLDVLLIGGSGFMGQHAARALLAAGHRVTVLSRGERGMPEGVTPLIADRADPAALARVLDGRHFDFSVDFLVYDSSDIERLLLVPYAALGRYVMISTGQVYMVTQGSTPPYREEDTDGPVTPEPDPATADHGQWSYGVGKRRAERVLMALRATHGVRAIALRLPIMQGEGDGSLRLWAYLERMLDGGPILLPDADQLTRFLDARDLAAALVLIAGGAAPRSAVYNLAQPDVLSLRDFLERVAEAAGLRPRFVEMDWPEIEAAGLDRTVSPFSGKWRSMLDPSRAAAEWGFMGTPSSEYLPRVVRWHLEHRPSRSHAGYARRALELEVAEKHAAATKAAPV
jgi:nucleoside-diphosphate-sugar epimerase